METSEIHILFDIEKPDSVFGCFHPKFRLSTLYKFILVCL